jgi:hypothetical protein
VVNKTSGIGPAPWSPSLSVLASTSRAVGGIFAAFSSVAPLQKSTRAKDRLDVIYFLRLSAMSGNAHNNVEVCGEFADLRSGGKLDLASHER